MGIEVPRKVNESEEDSKRLIDQTPVENWNIEDPQPKAFGAL